MAQPTLSSVHVSTPLTNVSLAYMQDLSKFFISNQVAPIVPVAKQTDKYYTYTKDAWFRDEAAKRAPGTPAVRGGYELSSDSYSCDVFAYAKAVDDQIRANADAAIDLDKEATEFVTRKMMLKKEIDFNSTIFAASTWTGSSTGADITASTKWDNASGTPIKDIQLEMDSMLGKTGFLPNTLVLPRAVWRAIKNSADFLNRIGLSAGATTSQPAQGTPAKLAEILELERVFVCGAVKNSAAEGATASMAFLQTEGAWLGHVASSPGLMVPTALYTFAWTAYPGANGAGARIKRWRDEASEADIVEGGIAFDHKVVAADLGVYFVDVLT